MQTLVDIESAVTRLSERELADIRRAADKKYELLKQNTKYPSLHFKRVNQYWSVRIGLHYRAVGIDDDEGIIWFWISSHTEYDNLIG